MRAGLGDCPSAEVLVRVWRRWSGGAFWASAGPLRYSDLNVGLCSLTSAKTAKPFASFPTDPEQDIEHMSNIAAFGIAYGWPPFGGRAAVIAVHGILLWSIGPVTTHARSPRLGERPLSEPGGA